MTISELVSELVFVDEVHLETGLLLGLEWTNDTREPRFHAALEVPVATQVHSVLVVTAALVTLKLTNFRLVDHICK